MEMTQVRVIEASIYDAVPLNAPQARPASAASSSGSGSTSEKFRFRPNLEGLETRIMPVWRKGKFYPY